MSDGDALRRDGGRDLAAMARLDRMMRRTADELLIAERSRQTRRLTGRRQAAMEGPALSLVKPPEESGDRA